MKPGWKSSELYVALAGIFTLLWGQIQARCNFDAPFLLTVAGVVITYILGRSWIKTRAK